MRPRALFVGDINVDLILGGLESLPVVDREITCQSFNVEMGSTAVLSACAYAGLGGDASILGLAGQDEYGEFMMRGLIERGVNTDLVRRTDKVGTGVTVNLVHAGTRTQVTYPGTIAEFDASDIEPATLKPFTHLHFAGPYLQTRLRPEITRILEMAGDLGLTCSLDPQWDPTGKWEFMDQWLPRLSFLFLNSDEAMAVSGTGSTEAAVGWLAARTRLAAVKTGANGALLWIDGRAEIVPPFPIQAIDTTGAGDSFDAGFLFATLNQKMEAREAARFANAVAARSCAFVGGTAARSSLTDIVEYMMAMEAN